MTEDTRRTARQIPRLSFLAVTTGDAGAASLREALGRGPARLHVIEDPLAILDALREREHDAVVLDLDVPTTAGGLVLAQAIRRDHEQSAVGIVVRGELAPDHPTRAAVDVIVAADASPDELRAAVYHAGLEGRRRRRAEE